MVIYSNRLLGDRLLLVYFFFITLKAPLLLLLPFSASSESFAQKTTSNEKWYSNHPDEDFCFESRWGRFFFCRLSDVKKFFFSIFSNASTDSSRESNLHFHSTLMTRHSAMGKKALLSSSSLVTKPDDARRLEVDKLIRQIGLNIGPMTHNRKLLRGHQEAFTKQRRGSIYWWSFCVKMASSISTVKSLSIFVGTKLFMNFAEKFFLHNH